MYAQGDTPGVIQKCPSDEVKSLILSLSTWNLSEGSKKGFPGSSKSLPAVSTLDTPTFLRLPIPPSIRTGLLPGTRTFVCPHLPFGLVACVWLSAAPGISARWETKHSPRYSSNVDNYLR